MQLQDLAWRPHSKEDFVQSDAGADLAATYRVKLQNEIKESGKQQTCMSISLWSQLSKDLLSLFLSLLSRA